MILMESLTQLFEAKSIDYETLIVQAAKALKGDKMVWSPAAKKLAQDKGLMDRVNKVAGSLSKSHDEREDYVQDWFVSKFRTVIRSADASIKKGAYKGDSLLTLVGVSVKNHIYNAKRGKKRRDAAEGGKKGEDFRALPSQSKRHGGWYGSKTGDFSDERKKLHDIVMKLVKKQSDEKSRSFLKAYFGLKSGKIMFSGMKKRDALKLAGLPADPKNEVWAGRLVTKALADLRNNKTIQRTIAAEAAVGIVQSRMMLAVIDEANETTDRIFVEWLVSASVE